MSPRVAPTPGQTGQGAHIAPAGGTPREEHSRRPLGSRLAALATAGAVALGLTGVSTVGGGAAEAASSSAGASISPVPGQFPDGGQTQAGTDNNVSVYVGGDYEATGTAAESEGLQVIVGNATYAKTAEGSFNIGTVGWGSGLWPIGDQNVLRVGKDLSVNTLTKLQVGFGLEGGGSVLVGETSDVDEGSAQLNLNEETITTGVGAATALSPYADFGSTVNALSSSLAGEEATGVVSEQDGVLTFTGNGKSGDLQVFSVAEAQLQSAKWDVSFVNVGDATTPILVNVVGTDTAYQGVDTLGDGDNLSAPGGAGFGNWASRILWNYPDATTLDIGGSTQFMGSILAPSAGATITPSTNGRVYVGGDLTVNGAGEEQHAFPWIGHDTTACQSGSLSVRNALTGDAAFLVPSDTSFTVSYTVTGGPDEGEAGELSVGDDGVPVGGPQLDEGDVVTLSEATPPVVDGVEWGSSSIDPQSLTVTTGTVPVITLTNTATRTAAKVGGFSVRKALSGVGASAFPGGTQFSVTAPWARTVRPSPRCSH